MDDEVDTESFHPARTRHAIVGGKVVAHHLHAEVASGVDDAADGGFVRTAHHHDEIGARLRHHLGLEIPAIHRFQIGDDRMIGKPAAKLLDGAQALGQEQRRAGLQPVHAGLDRDRRRLECLVERREIE